MKAKDMFKELDYELTQDDCDFVIYRLNKNAWNEFTIEFNKKAKEIHICTIHCSCGHTLSLQEFNAVNKQCEELGWITDKEEKITVNSLDYIRAVEHKEDEEKYVYDKRGVRHRIHTIDAIIIEKVNEIISIMKG